MEIILNKETNIREGFVNGTLKSISEDVRTLDNAKKTPYQWAKVEIVYPNGGGTAIVDSMLWTASLASTAKDSFTPGSTVSLAVQLDGDYAGTSKVGLPTIQKVDISMFKFDAVEVTEEVEAEA